MLLILIEIFIQFRSESGDQYAEIILEDQVAAGRKRVPWVFRANRIIAQWIGVQLGLSLAMKITN